MTVVEDMRAPPSFSPDRARKENNLKRFAVIPLAAVLALAACMDDVPTAPAVEVTPAVVPPTASSAVLDSAAVAGLSSVLSDVSVRLLPGLQDQAAAEEISSRLDALMQHVDAGNTAEARLALAEAQEILERAIAGLAKPEEQAEAVADEVEAADLAELGFVQLALDQARMLLSGDAAEGQ
jgi:hypothetical protein